MAVWNIVSRGLADFDLFPYTPSAASGWTFVILFSIGGALHLFFMLALRSWYFIPLVLGCAGEAGGYYGRAWAHENIRNGSPYLIQLMLILASTPLIAATIYMTLGRIIRALSAEEHAVMSTRWTTKIYVLIDIISFGCQMAGTAMQASGDPNGVKLGNNIVIGGLGFQLVALIFFTIMAAIFHHRLNSHPNAVSQHPSIKWKRNMWNLYAVNALVLVRSIFRLIEFAEGTDGPLYKTEVYLYVFDASIMFIVVLLMAAVHSGMLLRSIREVEGMLLSDDENNSFLLYGLRQK